jgi:hypothetical protein
MLDSGKIDEFIESRDIILNGSSIDRTKIKEVVNAVAFGLLDNASSHSVLLSKKGRDFFKWYIIENPTKTITESSSG